MTVADLNWCKLDLIVSCSKAAGQQLQLITRQRCHLLVMVWNCRTGDSTERTEGRKTEKKKHFNPSAGDLIHLEAELRLHSSSTAAVNKAVHKETSSRCWTTGGAALVRWQVTGAAGHTGWREKSSTGSRWSALEEWNLNHCRFTFTEDGWMDVLPAVDLWHQVLSLNNWTTFIQTSCLQCCSFWVVGVIVSIKFMM